MKKSSLLHNSKYIAAAFFVPVLITVLAFAVTGIYPFGDNQIAVIDMYHQYIPFLSELQSKLHEGGSLFYTWNGAGGSNFWNLLAYYGASPLNLLLALFPEKLIMEAVTVILLIKIGLAGSFMAIYLGNVEKKYSMVTVAFAVMYALCSYVMAYYWCIMWMDAVALLPLCILGLNRLIDSGRPVMYTVSLAIIVFCNYYIAIMVCIFILCYYPVLYFLKVRNGGVKRCVVTTGKAVGFSLLGVVMSAVMLLPTYISMQDTYYISADMPDEWHFYNAALDILNQLLPNAELTFREGLPNLYCGLIVVIMLVFYISSRTIELREKALNLGFLAFMFMSLNLNKLDFIWHGFHFPNQLPFRYSFVVCFVLVGIAYRTFNKYDEFRIKTLWGVLAAGMAYYVFAQKIFAKDIDDINLFFYSGAAWLALYCIVMVLYRKGYIVRGSFSLLITMLILMEMASGACCSFDKVGNTARSTYFENYEDVKSLADYTREEFVRTEMDDTYILNCPALYHYRGISQFSSSINANTTEIMEKIGIEGEPGKNRFNYNLTDPVTNAMLNIKYIITKNMPMDDPDFTLVKQEGNSRLYESRYPLSIGYMTGNEIRTWNHENSDPFIVLEDYVRAATGGGCGDVFSRVEESGLSGANVSVTKDGSGYFTATLDDETRKSRVVLEYKAEKTQKYYVFVEAGNADVIVINKGDKIDDLEVRNDCGSVINAGVMKKGETFRIIIDYKKGDIGNIRSHVCTLNQDAWDEAYGILSSSMLEVDEWSDTHVKGTVTAEEEGVLVTSIPYEKGWTLKVDGKKKAINELTGDVFISVPLDAGSHEIQLDFRPPGIIAGLLLTAACALLLAAFEIIRRKRLASSRSLPAFRSRLEYPEEESDYSTEPEHRYL